MSTKVVTAPASEAKRPVRSQKPAKQADEQSAVNEDEARLANDDSEQEVSVASVNEEGEAPVESETSMAGEFTFGGALAEAAAASGSLISDAEQADEVGFGAFGDGDGSAPLLIGAIALAALGLVFILKDGSNGDDDVTPVNQPPTITAPAAVTTAEDTAVTIAKPVTADPDGDTVTVTATSANGTLVKNADGSFAFTPAANFNGTATVTYTATDGTASVTTTSTVTVTPVNDAPTISFPDGSIDEDTSLTLTPSVNDVDGDDVDVTVTASSGTVVDNGDGTFTFTPPADFNGDVTLTLTATDGTETTTSTATVTVNPVNDAPELSPLTVETDEDTPLNLSDVLVISDDGDLTQLTSAITTQPTNGTIQIVNGDAIYTPTADYNGPDSVGITLTDDEGLSASYTVAINVTPVDDNPTASLDVGTPGGNPVNIDAASGDFSLTDDAEAITNVNIVNFTNGDMIDVTNAVAGDYNFTRDFTDINDLIITYTDAGTGATNRIVIQDILPDTGSVAGFANATTTVGFDFMTFA